MPTNSNLPRHHHYNSCIDIVNCCLWIEIFDTSFTKIKNRQHVVHLFRWFAEPIMSSTQWTAIAVRVTSHAQVPRKFNGVDFIERFVTLNTIQDVVAAVCFDTSPTKMKCRSGQYSRGTCKGVCQACSQEDLRTTSNFRENSNDIIACCAMFHWSAEL